MNGEKDDSHAKVKASEKALIKRLKEEQQVDIASNT